MVYIFLKETNKSNLYIINLYSSVFSFKTELAKKYKLKHQNIMLKYQGSILEDTNTFKFYKIKEKETLELIIKNNGGTISRGLLIFLAIIIVFWYVFVLLSGFLPIISHLVASAIIVPFRALGNLVLRLFSIKWPTKNFFTKYGNKVFSVFKFIISNLSILIFTIIITALAAFLPNYLHKKDLCRAIKSCFALGGITGVLFSVMYLIYSLPNIILSLIGTPQNIITRGLVAFFKKMIFGMKKVGLFFAFPLSGVYIAIINISEIILDKAADFEDFAENFLYNYKEFKASLSVPPYKQYLDGAKPVVEMYDYTYLPEKEQKKLYWSRCKITQSYMIRTFIENGIALLLLMFDALKSICPSSTGDDFDIKIKEVEKTIGKTEKKMGTNPSNQLKNKIEALIKRKISLEKDKDIAVNTEVINSECIMNYFVNGILASYPFTFIIWLILFFLTLFTPLAENLGK